MARITLRQLLDHAAEHGYGVPAFNVNNMEQVLAIMEAAEAVDAPVIMQASRGARSYAGDVMLAKMIEAAWRPCIRISRSACTRTTAMTRPPAPSAIQHGFTRVMMDGSLKADAKTPADYDYNVDITAQGGRHGPLGGRLRRGRAGLPGLARDRQGEQEDGHGAEGKLTHDQLLTDPDQAVDFVAAPRSTRWPSPWAPATAPTSSRASPTGDILAMDVIEEIHARTAQHPPGHARLLLRAAGAAGDSTPYGGEMQQT